MFLYQIACNDINSIEPKRIAIPTEDRRSNLGIRIFGTNAEVVQKPKLNSSAPTCFVALKTRIYAMLNANISGTSDDTERYTWK